MLKPEEIDLAKEIHAGAWEEFCQWVVDRKYEATESVPAVESGATESVPVAESGGTESAPVDESEAMEGVKPSAARCWDAL